MTVGLSRAVNKCQLSYCHVTKEVGGWQSRMLIVGQRAGACSTRMYNAEVRLGIALCH